MIELRPLGIEEYAERHSKPLSGIYEKLWLETYSKTHNSKAMVGSLEGAFLRMREHYAPSAPMLQVRAGDAGHDVISPFRF